jgi:hypothetical protein
VIFIPHILQAHIPLHGKTLFSSSASVTKVSQRHSLYWMVIHVNFTCLLITIRWFTHGYNNSLIWPTLGGFRKIAEVLEWKQICWVYQEVRHHIYTLRSAPEICTAHTRVHSYATWFWKCYLPFWNRIQPDLVVSLTKGPMLLLDIVSVRLVQGKLCWKILNRTNVDFKLLKGTTRLSSRYWAVF